MNEIVISYKVHDRSEAIQCYYQLKEKKLKPWFDQLIPKNANWMDTIEKHIANCEFVICFLSESVLKDDWVYKQVMFAKKYHKKVFFIGNKDLNLKAFKKYKIEYFYESIDDIDYKSNVLELDPVHFYRSYRKELKKGQYGYFWVLFFLTALSIYLFCYGMKLLNIKLTYQYGYLTVGLLIYFILSILPYRWSFVCNSVLALGVLAVGIYAVKPYYISDISINTVLFFVLFLLCSYIRFFKWMSLLDFMQDIVFTLCLLCLYICSLCLFKYLLDFDVSFLGFICLGLFEIYKYRRMRPFFMTYDRYQRMKHIYQL